MNTHHSNYTGRVHRTMESAFGPYARGPIQEQYDPMPKDDKLVVGMCLVAVLSLIAMALIGLI